MSGQTCFPLSRRGAPRFDKTQVSWERFRRIGGASLRLIIGTATPYPAVNLRLNVILSTDAMNGHQHGSTCLQITSPELPRNLSGNNHHLPIVPLKQRPRGARDLAPDRAITGSRGSRATLDTTELSKTGRPPKSGRRPVFFLPCRCFDTEIRIPSDSSQRISFSICRASQAPESHSVSRAASCRTSSEPQAAVRQILSRLVPRGTVGGRMAPTRKPRASSFAARC